jgi:hypothetical protein
MAGGKMTTIKTDTIITISLKEYAKHKAIVQALPVLVERWRATADNLADEIQAQALRDCADDLAFVLDGDNPAQERRDQ